MIENQKLLVYDHVTATEESPDDALVVQFMLGEGVKVEDKNPNTSGTTHGDKDHPVPYKTYKVKPGTDLSQYKNTILKDTIFNLISVKEDEGYAEPVWNDSIMPRTL